MIKLILVAIFSLFCLIPLEVSASSSTDPSVILLQNRISNNFTRKYCNAIDKGFSKDEAMRSAIIETENIVAFSLNPQKKWIAKDELAEQIAIKFVNYCVLNFGLIGKDGINYFYNYFLEINEKTTPNKRLTG